MLEWIKFSGKEGQKCFFSLALINDKFLYENEVKAFDIYRETEIRSSVLMKCGGGWRRRFLKTFSSSFSFSNYCSCFN